MVKECAGLVTISTEIYLRYLTLNCLSHSLRSSAFFLLKAMSMRARSSTCIASKNSRCLSRSLKYFFASAAVLVPRP
jgi:hypothetical protein